MTTASENKSYLPADFPSPTQLPDAEILIIDGNCGFCQANARALKRLAGKRIAFLSLHDPDVQRQFPDLTYERMMSEMVLVDHAGQRHGGAAVVRHLSLRCPWLWPLAPLMHIPFSLPLWQRIYQWIAVRRYKLGAKLNSPDDGDKSDEDDEDDQGACEDACSIHLNR